MGWISLYHTFHRVSWVKCSPIHCTRSPSTQQMYNWTAIFFCATFWCVQYANCFIGTVPAKVPWNFTQHGTDITFIQATCNPFFLYSTNNAIDGAFVCFE